MRRYFRGLIFFLALGILTGRPLLWADDSYQAKNQSTLVRGFKNIVGAPLEIPVTMTQYSRGDGRPVIREIAGFFDGVFRMGAREANGLFDAVMSFVPGEQDGYPVQPETLF